MIEIANNFFLPYTLFSSFFQHFFFSIRLTQKGNGAQSYKKVPVDKNFILPTGLYYVFC